MENDYDFPQHIHCIPRGNEFQPWIVRPQKATLIRPVNLVAHTRTRNLDPWKF